MEPATEQPKTAPDAADQKRPKILSVSQPSQPEQPKLSRPRILAQVQATPKPAIATASQQQLAAPSKPSGQTAGQDPKSEADWAAQTLAQAEKDAEEQRMASDVTQAFATTAAQPPSQQDGKPQDDQKTPKTEPKSVHGVLYAIKGLADSISRKLTGK
jgi:hypothetical protein